ncbi:3-oxoacyl-ACP synthase III family protein [Kitasatospora sp. NPDC048239]|uniref:3-oxoacyl-ACP synthase III family protein n=1 Tax=Kitasatospora sp. NPDC048239 TaxID=3364046 RepID=UPI00372361B6
MTGILAFETGLPAGRMDVKRMHAESGLPLEDILGWTHCSEIPVFGEDETAWELLSTAARRVLERTGVAPERIGQVIVAGSGEWDHPAWSPSATIAHELGITGAQCFEVVNFCNSPATALQIAADTVAAGRVTHSLVLLGERLSRSVDYADPESVALFNTGDSVVAVLVGTEDPQFELVHSRIRTDPSWHGHYVGEYEYDRVVVRRRARRLNLPQTYVKNYRALAEQTLTALGRGVEDVGWFLMNHMDKRVHERVLTSLGIPAERSVFNYHRLGHMGGGDTFLALADLQAEQRLRSGDLVLLATSGTGFSWGVTALVHR